jgi:hypothetical protein
VPVRRGLPARGDRIGILAHRQAFPCQRRLGCLQRSGLDDAGVRGKRVTFFHEDQITVDDLRGRERAAARRLAERSHRLLRGRGERALPLPHEIPERNPRIAFRSTTAKIGDGFVRQGGITFVQPESRRDGRRDEKQDHERVTN